IGRDIIIGKQKNPGRDGISVENISSFGENPVKVKPTLFPVRETISIEKICTAAGPKPRMGFHMMNHLRRLADVFRIDSIDMNALTGKAHTKCMAGVFAVLTLTGRALLPTSVQRADLSGCVVETRCIASLLTGSIRIRIIIEYKLLIRFKHEIR
ncbi:MAG: hypothetical protein LBL24_02990, partial [Bacteroidales bacterium]|nr:hypothetical protein [Bacteroidales bacterium]